MGHQLTFPFARHVVLFSKGHSSALVATEVVRRYGPDDVVLLNHDIHARVEDADAKRLVRKRAAIDAEAAAPARPCDCSYFPKRKPLAADPPPCTCGALAHGVPHGLACERGAFGAEMRAA